MKALFCKSMRSMFRLNFRVRNLVIGLLWFSTFPTYGQFMDGPDVVQAGQTYTYTVYDDVIYWSYSWNITGGYVVNSYQSGANYTAEVYFTTVGPGHVYFLNENLDPIAYKFVTIQSGCTAPANPSVSFSISSGTCPPRTLSYTGTPPGGITWYWQTSASGTDMSNSTNTMNVTFTGTFYVRAYNSSTGCWSSGGASYSATVATTPAVPATPSVSSNSCGSKTITRGSPPSGTTWYWQGTDANGTSTSNSATTFTASVTGTYYLRARNNTSGCWSVSSRSVYVTINPGLPSAWVASNDCGSSTLVRGTPPSGTVWYWQGTSSLGTSTSNSSSSYTATSSGTYYIRAYTTSSSCWSPTSFAVAVTINTAPSTPPTPSASGNTCGAKTLTTAAPPSGFTYYWQGTNASGTDMSNSTTTYSAAASGFYYLRSRNNTTGCWSSAGLVYVTVNNPATPGGGSSTYREWDTMTLSQGGLLLKWYDDQYNFLYQGTQYTVEKTVGTYTYKIKLVNGSCESPGYGTYTLIVHHSDQYLNWTQSTAYTVDGNGNSVATAASKSYLDGFGNLLQSQSKSYTINQVLASQPLYDRQGSPSASTLAAPINSASFVYRHRFVNKSDGSRYGASDFDLPIATQAAGEVNNPRPVGSQTVGTLGWYYSSNNNLETKTPVTGYPYVRGYSPEGPDPVTGKSAGVGEQHRMGSGHESQSERQLITNGELNHYYTIRAHFITGGGTNPNKGYKYISTDANGKQAVVFVDADGTTLASCTKTGSTYDNWSYTFYNATGQVVAEVAPNGVNTLSSAYPTFVTTYKYDHLGRLIESSSTDEGMSQYVYNLDGEIRFSQNQAQRTATPKRFSYTNYDYLGRLVESGEYTENGTNPFVFQPHGTTTVAPYSVLQPATLEAKGHTGVSRKLDAVRCKDYTYIEYDRPDTNYPTDAHHPSQTYTFGQITKTENENASTWYSYDEFGQLIWTKQHINELSLRKTVDYEYDFLGNVTTVIYQKGIVGADRFYHHYVYDADQRMSEVWTSLDGVSKTLRARYHYYLHGPLKRVELGGSVQGLDYVYTIGGALKTINSGNPGNDPGSDGGNGFAPDVFGQTLHYYDNDYTGAGYQTGNQTFGGYANQYGGVLKAVSWHSPVDNNQMRSYAFTYDNVYQFNSATFGNMLAGSFNTTGLNDAHKESVPSYDKNGNIQSLLRKGLGGTVTGDYGYVYEANTNKLDKINQNSSVLVDYSYNAIGQMIQQVSGSETMKVNYNAYGITKEVRNASDVLQESYHYDDRGDLLKRVDYQNGTAVRQTYYMRDASGNPLAIYQGSTLLEVPIYGAGRVGVFRPALNAVLYEIGDHLGNVRAVIGAPDTDIYLATMESENVATEQPPFKNISARRIISTAGNQTPGGNEVVRLNNTQPAGPTLSLAISPGDKIDLETWAYYEAGSNYHNPINSTTIIGAIAQAFGGVSGAPGEAGQIYNSINNALTSGGGTMLGGTGNPNLPGAYLAYLVLDVNKNFTGQGGYFRVTMAGNAAKEKLSSPQLTMEHPGYIYVFLYNRSDSPNWVFFDDMKVTHQRSPIVAGGDFYPFGLPMEGRQITQEDYRWGYQGQYAEMDTTTGWNQFQLRMYDARFGRWLSPDPYGQYSSPYLAMGNMPQSGIDPDGGWSWAAAGMGFAAGAGIGYAISGDLEGALIGGLAGGIGMGASFRSNSHFKASMLGGFWGSDYVNGVPTRSGWSPGAFNKLGDKLGSIFDDKIKYLRPVIVNADPDKGDLSRPIPEMEFPKISAPDFSKIKWPTYTPPCPQLFGVSFVDDFNFNRPRLATGMRTLQGLANYARNGGTISIRNFNTKYTGPMRINTTRTVLDDITGGSQQEIPISTLINARLNFLIRTLVSMGAPRNRINTRNVTVTMGSSNGNVSLNSNCQ